MENETATKYPHSVKNLQREIKRLNELVTQLQATSGGNPEAPETTTRSGLPWPAIPDGEAIAHDIDPHGYCGGDYRP